MVAAGRRSVGRLEFSSVIITRSARRRNALRGRSAARIITGRDASCTRRPNTAGLPALLR